MKEFYSPWSFEVSTLEVRDNTGDLIVDVDSGDFLKQKASDFGSLISAAPELLEALQWAMNKIGGYAQRTKTNGDYCDAVDKANAAIAKALGDS